MIEKINHVAIAVPDLAAATATYRGTLGARVSEPQPEPDHGVTVVFVELPNTKVELLEPLGEDSPINGFLAKSPAGGIHHICYEVDDILAACDRLRTEGARVLGDGEPRIGAHGKPVLDQARVAPDLSAALQGCVRTYATTSKLGMYRRQVAITPEAAATEAAFVDQLEGVAVAADLLLGSVPQGRSAEDDGTDPRAVDLDALEELRQPLAAVKTVADHLRNEADVELWHEPDTGILCFRIVPEGFPQGRLDQLQQTIYDRIMAEGKRSVSATRLDDCLVLRLVAISPSVTAEALMETISHVRTLASEFKHY